MNININFLLCGRFVCVCTCVCACASFFVFECIQEGNKLPIHCSDIRDSIQYPGPIFSLQP